MSTPLAHEIFKLDLPSEAKLVLLAIDHALSIDLEPNNLAHLRRLTGISLGEVRRWVSAFREAGVLLGNPITRIDITPVPKLAPFEAGGEV